MFGYVGEGGEICKLGVAEGSYVSATATGSGSGSAGGIAGRADGTISGCYNTGEVTASSDRSNHAGGIAGRADGTISECYNTGAVKASGNSDNHAGGIAGLADGTISGCYNTGEVTASSDRSNHAGGIAGYASGVTISGCYNTGTVTVSRDWASGSGIGSCAGGIAGFACTTISECYNTGAVKASGNGNYIGGIAGQACGTTITGCYNTGAVTVTDSGNSFAGGILGQDDGGITISGCYYLKKDEGDTDSKGAQKGVGNKEDTKSNCVAKKLEDMQKDGFAKELNDAIAKFEEGKEDEYKVRPEGGDVFVPVPKDTPELWWEKALAGAAVEKLGAEVEKLDVEAKKLGVDVSELQTKLNNIKSATIASREVLKQVKTAQKPLADLKLKLAKIKALAAVKKIEVEVIKQGQLYEVSVDEELKSLDEIKTAISLAATSEKFPEQVEAAQGVLQDFRTKLQGAAVNLGHTRSSIGGDSGFYKASNGVVTFRVVPNPGYKISRIVTSGSEYLKPGTEVKALPERVTVNFEKV